MSTSAVRPAHQFADLQQQHNAASLGMWLFLATEILVFGAIFTGYAAYRYRYHEGFQAASDHLNLLIGGVNTFVLPPGSLTMTLAVLPPTRSAWPLTASSDRDDPARRVISRFQRGGMKTMASISSPAVLFNPAIERKVDSHRMRLFLYSCCFHTTMLRLAHGHRQDCCSARLKARRGGFS